MLQGRIRGAVKKRKSELQPFENFRLQFFEINLTLLLAPATQY